MRKERNEVGMWHKTLVFVSFVALIFVAVKVYSNQDEKIQILNQSQQTTAKKYIISKEMVMSRLKTRSQIVSLEQNFDKNDTFVDINWVGERHTDLIVHGTVKLGLNTDDIEIKHIDSNTGIIYLKLGEPILISLDIPYDKIEFTKTQGFLRFSMNEKEQKDFYKLTKSNIKIKLLKDESIMKQADLLNKDAVTKLLQMIPNVKGVIYE